jgi:hypothetical protein
MKGLLLIITYFVISGFSAFGQAKSDTVLVLPMSINPPAGAQKLGSITAGNNATATTCDYEAVINEAREKARELGGNIVKITKLAEPAFISKCYKIKADVYLAKQLPYYKIKPSIETAPTDNINADYATLYIYRLRDTLATISSGYNLHMDKDSVICSVKSNSREPVKIYKDGPLTIWAKKEKRVELKLNLKTGETYYIRCGVAHGEMGLVPVMELIDKTTGAAEYGTRKKERKESNVKYLQDVH